MDGLRNKINTPTISKRVLISIGIFLLFLVLIVTLSILTLFGVTNRDVYRFFKKDWLNVHLIPHTHDDVGWLKTPEDYYKNYVKYIISHVVRELHSDPERKFVYVETYFFWQWWQEQTDHIKQIVRGLIQKKQLEIIGGGWCMSDEAVTHYQSFIDQSTWGFRRLNDTFGAIAWPTAAWQIDTFGHSKGIASLLAQMGFDSLFFARVDVNERKFRRKNKLMEFIWEGNENLGESSSIFTSIFYDHYSAPSGFDFEMQPSQETINFEMFSNFMRNQALVFRTKNILVPMGDDFRFFNARKYFQKMDELINFFKQHKGFKLNVFYSTPSLYIEHIRKDDLTWPVKQGDFFPYSSEYYAYWTGYFTSRPTLKYFERLSNNILQISKQLLVFSNKGMQFFNELTSLKEAIGVVQHHDAITGTAKQHVTDHYVELLYEGIQNCSHPVDEALGTLSFLHGNSPRPIYTSCLLLNISVCSLTEHSSRFVITVYNPLSRKVNHYVRVPVRGQCYSVRSADGAEMKTQIVPIPKSVRRIPGRTGTSKTELVFKAAEIPAMGFKSFYVSICEVEALIRTAKSSSKFFSKKPFKLILDQKAKLLSGVKTTKRNISLSQSIRYYKSNRYSSGAYLFQPQEPFTYPIDDLLEMDLLSNGDLVTEYEQTFSDWASQVIRVYQDEEYVEFEWLVGPIPTQDFVGKDVTVHYATDIKSGKVFYTDMNGMDMMERVKDYHSWGEERVGTVGGNYYPVTTMISLKDDYNQMYVVIDRPQGGTSLRSGEIELMVHRRLCYDDGKGVEEPLNETAFGVGLVARGRHWVLLGEKKLQLDQNAKLFAQMKHSEPWLFFFDASSLSFDQWRSSYMTEFSGLHSYVPRNVRILTLEPWREDTILLRLEHVFEKYPQLQLANAPVQINLQHLFENFLVLEARETTLGADRWLSESTRLKWRKDSYKFRSNSEAKPSNEEEIILPWLWDAAFPQTFLHTPHDTESVAVTEAAELPSDVGLTLK